MKSKLISLLGLIFFGGCQVEVIDNNDGVDGNSVKTVAFSTPGVYDDTRVQVQFTGSYSSGSYQNYIFNTDTIGIFPAQGDQIPFVIEGLTTPAPNFSFQAKGWDLKTNVKYYAYSPFSRSNFADSINIRHINVSYIGQKQDSITSRTNTNLLLDFNNQSRYSYMYSYPTKADAYGNLTFKMQYLGGGMRARLQFRDYPPELSGYNKIRVFYSKITAQDPIFVSEGTYALDTVGNDKETADLAYAAAHGGSGTDLSFIPKITPTKRGLTNVLPMRLDTFTLYKVTPAYYGMYYFINLPPAIFTGHNVKLNVYDIYLNWYAGDIEISAISPQTISAQNINMYYKGKAKPEQIYIAPWDSINETINSNWNYK